ncbi:hypothetical protein [Streptomyces sp. NPDC001037]|uniref:hypothetical protein n=1 Tax=Streptomyces sp. NPDC001037 TaxID=3364542 RepID=UPI003689712F
MRQEILDVKGFEYLKREISEVNEASVGIALSGDPGEYVWFRDITANPDAVGVATLDEAQRALGFVFGWIVRWESFQDSYIPDRMYQRQVEQRRVRVSSGPARVNAVRVSGEEGILRVEVDLVDVPDNDDFNVWRDTLSHLLNDDQRLSMWWSVTESGRIVLQATQRIEVAAELVERISLALIRVEDEVMRKQSADEASRSALQAEAVSYGRSYEAIESTFPNWVENVWLTDHLEIVGGVPQSRLMFSVADSARGYSQVISSGLRGYPQIESCFLSGSEGSFRVSPQLDIEVLCSALQSVSKDIEDMIARDVQERRAEEETRRSLEAELKEKFRLQ